MTQINLTIVEITACLLCSTHVSGLVLEGAVRDLSTPTVDSLLGEGAVRDPLRKE